MTQRRRATRILLTILQGRSKNSQSRRLADSLEATELKAFLALSSAALISMIEQKFWQSLKKLCSGFQSHLKFSNIKVSLNPTYRIF